MASTPDNSNRVEGLKWDQMSALELPEDELNVVKRRVMASHDPGRVLGGISALAASHPDVIRDQEARDVLLTLSEQGPYPQQILVSNPEWIVGIAQRRKAPVGLAELSRRLDAQLEPTETFEALYRTLRRFKRIESLLIFLREVDEQTSIRETTAEIAALAEACTEAALKQSARILGCPELVEHFVVLGLGKLGGRELNFSSDIDIIYVCSDELDDNQMVQIDRLAREVTASMDATTSDGYVFRVDLRLRPEGSQGQLVQPRTRVFEYYANWGRTWERSALIKARPVAGNLNLGNALLDGLEPVIFRKYLDYEAIDELRAMKDKIDSAARASSHFDVAAESEASFEASSSEDTTHLKKRLKAKIRSFGQTGVAKRRTRPGASEGLDETESSEATDDKDRELGWDVKLGVGGIREIEFFVQALQLVHCGSRKNLRVRNTLEALDRLLYSGLIHHEDHARLSDAYAFLRRVEHRIQMYRDRQSHRIPTRQDDFARLARQLRLPVATLRAELDRHREAVRDMFSRLFTDPARDETEPTVGDARPDDIETLLSAPTESLDSDAALEAFTRLGFLRPRQVAGQMTILRQKTYGPFSERAKADDIDFARYLLENAAGAPDPDQAFSFLTRFQTSIGDRAGYHRMLRDNPHATRLLVHVFGSSQYLAGALLRQPAIFERLLGIGTVEITRTRESMSRDLDARLEHADDPEHRIGVIRRFRREETLRIGLHEIGGASTIVATHTQLSMLAEVVLSAVAREVYEPLRTRRRRPGSVLPGLEEIPFAILALGKLGGQEMGFGSDLDLIFVYQEDRQWKLEHAFFTRLARRIIRVLDSATTDGKLYDVDTRLRPSGRQGALVVSLDAFEEYHATRAELWERQALLRARPVQGNQSLCETLSRLRVEFVFGARLGASANHEVYAMAEQLRAARDEGGFDVKFSKGGLLDVEFLTQYLQLRYVSSEIAASEKGSQNTHTALLALAEDEELGEAFPDLDLKRLAADYLTLRKVEARLRLADHRGDTVLPTDARQRAVLARRLGHQGTQALQTLDASLDAATKRIQAAWSSVLSVSGSDDIKIR